MRRLLPRLLILLAPTLCGAAGFLSLGGGLNVTSTSNDKLFQPPSPPNPAGYVPDPEARNGYNVGIGYERDLRQWLALGAELNLETRGENATIKHPNPALPVIEVELRMLYLQVPVFVTVKHAWGPFTAGLFGGPSVGRIVQAERERKVNGASQPVQEEEANRTDFGVEAGGTFEYSVGPGAVFARPSHYWGLLDFPENYEAKHRALKLRVGYKYAL